MLESNIYEILLGAVERAASASFKWINQKNNIEADKAAVSAMRNWLLANKFPGKIVIGEGERDQAPMLYIGEKFNNTEILYDIAVDPLEGTDLCANNKPNSMSVLAVGKTGTLLNAPDLYMKKLAVDSDIMEDEIHLSLSLSAIIKNIAKYQNKKISEVNLTILNRERHQSYIEEARSLGVKLNLIDDGDILAAINCSRSFGKTDLYYGTGGAPEGVLAAAALKCFGGKFFGQLQILNEQDRQYSEKLGISAFDKIYSIDDLVKDDVIFVASGITDGELLKAVTYHNDYYEVNSILCHYSRKINRIITTKQFIP